MKVLYPWASYADCDQDEGGEGYNLIGLYPTPELAARRSYKAGAMGSRAPISHGYYKLTLSDDGDFIELVAISEWDEDKEVPQQWFENSFDPKKREAYNEICRRAGLE